MKGCMHTAQPGHAEIAGERIKLRRIALVANVRRHNRVHLIERLTDRQDRVV